MLKILKKFLSIWGVFLVYWYTSGIDISTDGIWCYIVLWVVPHSSSVIVKWSSLKNRLFSVCPSCSPSFFLYEQSTVSSSSPVYLLKFFSLDRRGLLHGKDIFVSSNTHLNLIQLKKKKGKTLLLFTWYNVAVTFYRCDTNSIRAWAYNPEGENNDNSRWQSLGPLLCNRQ